ncbi:MAG: peptidylprolyl isomerase [Rhodothermales bacterium]|nr:peptidylprolyl isomerase [Rhodothermales bacterium]MBO6778346.1 peptidylprolyl isomerase [Rhodothermales bacterium]
MSRVLPVLLLTLLLGCAQPQDSDHFAIETQLGTMVVRLYDEQTPGHAENFRKLANEGFYDGTLFHRVIPRFMVQGGDPNSKDGNPMNNGVGSPGYTQPAEIKPELFHKRGAVAAARRPNSPGKASSGSQFYIVVGRQFSDQELDQVEAMFSQRDGAPFKFPPGQREVYKTEGGVPQLDGGYTVFGELVEGFDVLDAISRVDTPNGRGTPTSPVLGDQPLEPIPMVVRPVER